jgi:hypothetical protein
MLQEKSNEDGSPSAEGDNEAKTTSQSKEYELMDIALPQVHERYKNVLIQAYMLDEARVGRGTGEERCLFDSAEVVFCPIFSCGKCREIVRLDYNAEILLPCRYE